jgi:hypothetical protein
MIPAREAQRSRHAAQAPALRAGTQTSFKKKAFAELATEPDAAALFNTRPVDWVPAFAGMTGEGAPHSTPREVHPLSP